MKPALPRETGLDARFEAELAKVVPGWNSAPAAWHNREAGRFELEAEGKRSVAEYRIEDGRMIMTHTFVPPELRGRGLAEKVVRAALEYARAEKLQVVPQCSYVETFIRHHPELAVNG